VLVALVVAGALLLTRLSRHDAITTVDRLVAIVLGAQLGNLGLYAVVHARPPVLGGALAASIGMAVADLALARLSPDRKRLDLRSALPAHLTLACAGALIAVSVSEVGVAMAAVAAFPLLITRFSFERYAGATDTLEQTVQALGLVPELAGLAPLGHSERSAQYALALARELGFDRSATSRVVTATRLHHLGSVPFEADAHDVRVPTGEVAAAGARILREAKFPEDVAALLATANADSMDATAPTLEAAVVRIAAIFDELVGDDAAGADQGLSMVTASARDPHSRRAAAALMELVATDADLVSGAVAAGDRFRDAATGLDLQSVAAGRGELLPFTRRA
jgi:hypothetical protein